MAAVKYLSFSITSAVPGHSVQKKNGAFALDGDVSADLDEALVFVMLRVKLLLEHCIKQRAHILSCQ